MTNHIHYWVLDKKGKGVCKCGEERQFTNYLQKADIVRTYQHKTLEERKERAMDIMLNEYAWPVS